MINRCKYFLSFIKKKIFIGKKREQKEMWSMKVRVIKENGKFKYFPEEPYLTPTKHL